MVSNLVTCTKIPAPKTTQIQPKIWIQNSKTKVQVCKRITIAPKLCRWNLTAPTEPVFWFFKFCEIILVEILKIEFSEFSGFHQNQSPARKLEESFAANSNSANFTQNDLNAGFGETSQQTIFSGTGLEDFEPRTLARSASRSKTPTELVRPQDKIEDPNSVIKPKHQDSEPPLSTEKPKIIPSKNPPEKNMMREKSQEKSERGRKSESPEDEELRRKEDAWWISYNYFWKRFKNIFNFLVKISSKFQNCRFVDFTDANSLSTPADDAWKKT